MSNAFVEPSLRRSERPASARPVARAQVGSSQGLSDVLALALAKQAKLLEAELREAREGDAESVRAAQAATRRIAVVLRTMRALGGASGTRKLRRRVASLRRALERAQRGDALIDAALDRNVARPQDQDGLRNRTYTKLRRRLDAPRTQRTLTALRRLASAPGAMGAGLAMREVAARELRRASAKVREHGGAETSKRQGLKRLERDAVRLLYTAELFADVLTSAAAELRSHLAAAEAQLTALRDAELAFENQPSTGRRRRRDSLRATIAHEVAFLTGQALRDEIEAAIGDS